MKSIAHRISSHLTRLLFIGLTVFVSQSSAQIYHVKDMNTEQIKALDREKTVVLLPEGILEEHGPSLPSFTDGYIAERRTEDLGQSRLQGCGASPDSRSETSRRNGNGEELAWLLGSPGFASAAAGATQWKVNSSRWAELALKILNGFDYRQMKRLGDEIRVGEGSVGKTFRQHNQEIATKQREWLQQKGLE
jgi:hypothetical protein